VSSTISTRSPEPDFRRLFESAPAPYLAIRPDPPRYTIVAASDAYLRNTRTTREDILGRALFEVLADEPHDLRATGSRDTEASLARVIATGQTDVMPARSHEVRRSGVEGDALQERWWCPVHSPVFGPGGELVYVLHRIEDVTETVCLAEASVERRALAIAHIGTWSLDRETGARHWSDELHRIFGVPPGTPPTRERALALIHPEDRAHVELTSKSAGDWDAVDIQYRIVVGDETRWVRARAEPEPDARGRRVGTVQDITDLKRMEEALHVKDALFEQARDGFFVTDANGSFTEVNPAGAAMLGYSRDELLRMSVADVLRPEDMERRAGLMERLQRTASDLSEWQLRRKDGTFVLVEVSANLLPGARMGAVVRDVTARVEAAEAVRRSEAKYSGIVSISADAIISIDDDQRITLFNQGAEKIFGYTRDEAMGQPLDILLPERFHHIHRREVTSFGRGPVGARHMGERGASIVGRRKNGEEFPADAAISKLDLAGRPLLTVALRDATEQKRAEQEQHFLSEVGAVLATTLDFDETVASIARLSLQLGDWSVLHTIEGSGRLRRSAVSFSDSSRRLAAEALQKLPMEPGKPHLAAAAMASKKPVILHVETREQRDAITQNEAHRRLVDALGISSVMAVPLIAHTHVLGALVVVSASAKRRFTAVDLSLLEGLGQRAALALENAQLYHARQLALDARDNVLGIVAHDLRNPLNVILMAIEANCRSKDSAAARAATVVSRAARRMDRLIQDLLDVTRAQAGCLALACKLAAPGSLVSEVADTQRALAERAGLELRSEVPADLPDVWADAERLGRVLENLVGNALKFTPRGGRVTVGARSQGHDVEFRVEDTGPGIPPQLLPHVFERFWQAHESSRAGAGLGLAIAKEIVEAHGGHISVESTPGQGTIFRFTIPVARMAQAA
jgi:PAS domain S-box-containing protein